MIFPKRREGGTVGPIVEQLIRDQEGTPVMLFGRIYDSDGYPLNNPAEIEAGTGEIQMDQLPLQAAMVGYLGVLDQDDKDLAAVFKNLPILDGASKDEKLNAVRLVFHDFLQSINKGDA